MKAPLGIGLVGLFMVLSAYSAAGQAQAPFRDSGSALFGTYCASCHGRDAHGDGPIAESRRPGRRSTQLQNERRSSGPDTPCHRSRGARHWHHQDAVMGNVHPAQGLTDAGAERASTPSSAIWTRSSNERPLKERE
jgi:mono/diheme cytochrome c family protein